MSKDMHFQLLKMSPGKILSILEGLKPSKAASIENLSGKFLKNGTDVLAESISQLCNLSIKLNSLPRSCKIVIVLKKALTPILKTTTYFTSPPLSKTI